MGNSYQGAAAHLEVASPPRAEAQARCDSIVADFRANPFAAATPHLPAVAWEPPPVTDDLLMRRLAHELEDARGMLDAMGDALTADPAVLMRHSVSLQSVDIVGQTLGHIANVVRSSRPADMVELIGMCELKARLTRSAVG